MWRPRSDLPISWFNGMVAYVNFNSVEILPHQILTLKLKNIIENSSSPPSLNHHLLLLSHHHHYWSFLIFHTSDYNTFHVIPLASINFGALQVTSDTADNANFTDTAGESFTVNHLSYGNPTEDSPPSKPPSSSTPSNPNAPSGPQEHSETEFEEGLEGSVMVVVGEKKKKVVVE
ncbi:putative L-type lectin-domain containing receptor kinase S.5 [Senna tora]|uniref:Putative L-type lectin-domain containing receptor kinase S.5 n=1 Tax=Senna tora TaxID=362788 RepID=A0A835C9N0_9FABA|nr:putative L-type lectin-domain containing receptor kinase S.5 [Senna tora]